MSLEALAYCFTVTARPIPLSCFSELIVVEVSERAVAVAPRNGLNNNDLVAIVVEPSLIGGKQQGDTCDPN